MCSIATLIFSYVVGMAPQISSSSRLLPLLQLQVVAVFGCANDTDQVSPPLGGRGRYEPANESVARRCEYSCLCHLSPFSGRRAYIYVLSQPLATDSWAASARGHKARRRCRKFDCHCSPAADRRPSNLPRQVRRLTSRRPPTSARTCSRTSAVETDVVARLSLKLISSLSG